jgi:hypothetical protein
MVRCSLTEAKATARSFSGRRRRTVRTGTSTVHKGADVPDIEDCLRQVMAIRGALGASLIDYPSGLTMACTGRGTSVADDLAGISTVRLARATLDTAASATIGRPNQVEDVAITAENGYHLLHFPASGPGGRLVLYLWLDRTIGNLAITQRSLHTIGTQLSA